MSAEYEDLVKIQDIGEVIADSVYKFFKEEKNINTINELKLLARYLQLKQLQEL